MLENVFDSKEGHHQHIDHIYFTKLVTADREKKIELKATNERPEINVGWLWATLSELKTGMKFKTPSGEMRRPPEDVLKLGSAAIIHVMNHESNEL